MNFRGKLLFIRQNIFIYVTGAFLILGMKYFYSGADCESLLWILGPTARLVEALSGIPFAYEPGMGYANHELRFLIAPSCSGVQFMIITAALLIFSFSHRVGKRRCPQVIQQTATGLGWIAASLLLSYLFTVFVNGLRIIAAIYLPPLFERAGALNGTLTPDRLHTMIGAVVYFASLLTLYRLVGLFFCRGDETDKDRSLLQIFLKCLSPVFWYFFIVLGIPFLNRAHSRSGKQFTEFALLVAICCGSVLVLYCLGTVVHRRLGSRR